MAVAASIDIQLKALTEKFDAAMKKSAESMTLIQRAGAKTNAALDMMNRRFLAFFSTEKIISLFKRTISSVQDALAKGLIQGDDAERLKSMGKSFTMLGTEATKAAAKIGSDLSPALSLLAEGWASSARFLADEFGRMYSNFSSFLDDISGGFFSRIHAAQNEIEQAAKATDGVMSGILSEWKIEAKESLDTLRPQISAGPNEDEAFFGRKVGEQGRKEFVHRFKELEMKADPFKGFKAPEIKVPDFGGMTNEAVLKMRAQAEAMSDQFVTPMEQFRKETDKVRDSFMHGLIGPRTYKRAIQDLTARIHENARSLADLGFSFTDALFNKTRQAIDQPAQAPAAIEADSGEALSFILSSQRDEERQQQQAMLRAMEEAVRQLKELAVKGIVLAGAKL